MGHAWTTIIVNVVTFVVDYVVDLAIILAIFVPTGIVIIFFATLLTKAFVRSLSFVEVMRMCAWASVRSIFVFSALLSVLAAIGNVIGSGGIRAEVTSKLVTYILLPAI